MLVTFANNSAHQAMWVGIFLLIVHFIDANILMPRIVGSRVKMNAFVTIIAVIVGEYVWGVAGMFLFIPITGIFKIISSRVEGMKPWATLIGTEEKEELVTLSFYFLWVWLTMQSVLSIVIRLLRAEWAKTWRTYVTKICDYHYYKICKLLFNVCICKLGDFY
jgi:hypothetical protein